MAALTYELIRQDPGSHARLGRVTTPHGSFDTPVFMPVGTQAAMKGLLPADVEALGAQIILSNTYHLMLRPGSELVAEMGGLHGFMGWHRPILTDSGGFQVFSLVDVNRITDQGVSFRSHLDGRAIELTPEASMRVQNELGADIIMAFDDCPPAVDAPVAVGGSKPGGPGSAGDAGDPDAGLVRPLGSSLTAGRHRVPPAEYARRVRLANERTARWLERCAKAHARPGDQALFGIVQGGTDLEQRDWSLEQVTQHDLPGYAIGGVAVGEGPDQIARVVTHTAPRLPADRPRYLMGVGYERDILRAVRAGVDMFDCVLPTRNGRNANAFTSVGQIRLKNARFKTDPRPIDPGCDCAACGGSQAVAWGGREPGGSGASPGYSRAYLRHLFLAGEMLGPILVSLHNLRHFQRYLLDIRRAIAHNDWSLIAQRWPIALDQPPGASGN